MSAETLVIAPRWIVPVRPAGMVLEDHVCVVRGNRIEAMTPVAQAREVYASARWIERPGHVVLPGLVNAHTHAAMVLMRGMADDTPLAQWLQERIWPAEVRWMSAEMVADGQRLAAAEMLLSGTTCFIDSYFFPDAAASVIDEVGMRAGLAMPVLEFPTPWADTAKEYLRKAQDLIGEWQAHPRIDGMLAPHAPYTVSDETFSQVRELAQRLQCGVHLHLHETAGEVEDAVRDLGKRPFTRIAALGLTGPGLMAVHMTQLNDDEIAAVADAGVNVMHCPQSNQKLASGFCPVEKLRRAGVNVALGTDGAASNNDLDMFDEMRSAALTGKAVAGDARALPASWVLESATLAGARAMGREQDFGTLEVGKQADLIAVDLSRPATEPVYDVVSQLVYAASREQVTDVWVAGRQLLEQRRLTTIDESSVIQRAREWRDRIRGDHG